MFINNMEGINRSNTKKAYDRMINKINIATEAYIANNENIENDIKHKSGIFQINIASLIEGGFLDKDLIDPNTNNSIDRQQKITIKYMCDGKYKVIFPDKNSIIEYIESTPITIDSLPGGLSSIDFLDLNTINFRLINSDGNVITLTQTTGSLSRYRIKVVNRTFSTTNLSGVYEITYNYFDNNNDCRRYSRQVTLY